MKKNSGLTAGGRSHAEIRPGDIWKDRHGSRVIILASSRQRVEYLRIGYDNECISSPGRFIRDFVREKGRVNETDVKRFLFAADGDEKIRVLREIIQERLKK